MRTTPETILGINPGAKYLGIAVLQGGDLRDWRVKIIKGEWSAQRMAKILAIIEEYIDQYNSTVVCLKKINTARSSAQLLALTQKIRTHCKRKGIQLHEYSIQELEAFHGIDGNVKNKRDLAEIVAAHYPILFNELDREKIHKNSYHIRMFEAVALASACM